MDPAANSSSDDDSDSEDRHVSDPVREAISTINDGNGVDIDGIYEFVKARRDVMPNYRDVLEGELNTRVSRNELEKVGNLYRIIHVVSSESCTYETTEPDSDEPAAVPDPPITSSDIPSSSSSGESYDDGVLKAVRTVNDGNGADIDEIFEYLKEGYDIGPEHRKLVEESLDLSVSDNLLEMVGNRYRIVNVTSEDTNETRETESKSVEDSDDQKVPAASSTDYALPYGDMPEAMVMEAISTMDYGYGVDIEEIYEYIENRYKIPTDYMTILEDELNKRVSGKELEKGEYGYKILGVTSDNMDESQSQAVAVADQKDPATSSSSAASSSSRNPPYDPVIDAVSTINGGNGADIDGIFEFIQAKMERILSENFRKHLEQVLKKRVSQCILEKVETHYKILHLTPEKLDEISEAATKAVAVSDQKELEAKEASEAADRAKKVLEENQLVLQAAKEALDRCTRGD